MHPTYGMTLAITIFLSGDRTAGSQKFVCKHQCQQLSTFSVDIKKMYVNGKINQVY